MAAPLVLVVDDDASILRALERALRLEGFEVLAAGGGDEALEAVRSRTPQAVVLDVTMPDVDGITVLRRLRGAGDDVPVLVLSARDGLDDRVAGLRAGADDYLVKPFALAELVARLQALLRRRAPSSVPVREVGRLRVDRARHVARVDGEEIELTHREFELLACLADHAGMVLSRRQLLEQVWGYDFDAQTNVVEVFVSYLRRKLEADGRERLVHTVRGRGYVLRA